jgi:hypothetical protein
MVGGTLIFLNIRKVVLEIGRLSGLITSSVILGLGILCIRLGKWHRITWMIRTCVSIDFGLFIPMNAIGTRKFSIKILPFWEGG